MSTALCRQPQAVVLAEFVRLETVTVTRNLVALRLTTVIVLLNFCVLGHFMGCFYWYIGNGWPSL